MSNMGDGHVKREYHLEDYENSGLAKPELIDFKGHRSVSREIKKVIPHKQPEVNIINPW